MGLGRQWEERLKLWDGAFVSNLYQKLDALALLTLSVLKGSGSSKSARYVNSFNAQTTCILRRLFSRCLLRC